MHKLLNFRFPEVCYFLNCDNTEVKRSKIFFFCFRAASLGGSRVRYRRLLFSSHEKKRDVFQLKTRFILFLILLD